uniref:Uncharacterized protein n=1 Tax=Rhizophora mucronata TaxID=61149 RepID=A0A2P2NDF9_RHIMU
MEQREMPRKEAAEEQHSHYNSVS